MINTRFKVKNGYGCGGWVRLSLRSTLLLTPHASFLTPSSLLSCDFCLLSFFICLLSSRITFGDSAQGELDAGSISDTQRSTLYALRFSFLIPHASRLTSSSLLSCD